jgi:HEAT repeat protein
MDAEHMNSEKPDFSFVVEDLLTNPDPAVRRHAAEELAASDGYSSIAGLTAALRDENKGVREAAQRSLLSLGSEQVARSVVDYIAETNIVTRNIASDILVQMGPLSVKALLPLLYESDRDVRKFAVDILGLIGDSASVSRIIPLLDDPDDNVVFSVAEALGNIRSEEAVQPLCTAYENHADAKSVAAEALGKIGGQEAAKFLLKHFCELVQHPVDDPLLIYTILESLSHVGGKKSLTILRQHLRTFKGKLRHLILHCIIRINERCGEREMDWNEYKPYLLDAVHDGSAAIRLSVSKALLNFHEDDVTEALLSVCGMDEELSGLLAQALPERDHIMRITVQGVEKGLLRFNKTVYEILQRYIARYTYKTIPGEFLKDVTESLSEFCALLGRQWQDADQEIRPVIIDLLFKADGDHAIEFLAGITEYPDPWLRMQVIELLGPIEDRRATEFLMRFLADEDEMVRQLAFAILETKGYTGELANIPVMGA